MIRLPKPKDTGKSTLGGKKIKYIKTFVLHVKLVISKVLWNYFERNELLFRLYIKEKWGHTKI